MEYDHEMAKCTPDAFIQNFKKKANNLKPLPPLKF